jgi:negative regulator of sigma E activity
VTRTRVLTAAAAGFVVLAVCVAARAEEPAGDDAWSTVVDDARDQLDTQSFEGHIVVRWDDGERSHRAELDVRQHNGVVEITDDVRTVASDHERVMLDGQAWTTLARSTGDDTTALAGAKYQIVKTNGPEIAGNDTTRYEARRQGRVVERVYVLDDSSLVLRREVFDADGDVVRSVSFVRVDDEIGRAITTTTEHPAPGPERVDDLDAPFRDPDSAGDGYRLLGRWAHDDDLAQLYYSDGVLSVSVFEQPGRLEWDQLPPGGVDAEVNGHRARRYALPVGEAWVFERGGVVYTCVGDAPASEIAVLARDVSRPSESRVERLARTVVDPFRW